MSLAVAVAVAFGVPLVVSAAEEETCVGDGELFNGCAAGARIRALPSRCLCFLGIVAERNAGDSTVRGYGRVSGLEG